jgi:hypothetical protein
MEKGWKKAGWVKFFLQEHRIGVPYAHKPGKAEGHCVDPEQNHAHLCCDCKCRNLSTKSKQQRFGGNIIIPNIVMNYLESPDALASSYVERNDRVCVTIVARPVDSIKVNTCATSRHINQSKSGIGSDDRPSAPLPLLGLEFLAQGKGSKVHSDSTS